MTRAQTQSHTELLSDMKRRLQRRGIKTGEDTSRFPIGIVHGEQVQIMGNVHLPIGRVAKRKAVDKWFAKLKF